MGAIPREIEAALGQPPRRWERHGLKSTGRTGDVEPLPTLVTLGFRTQRHPRACTVT